MAVARSDGSGDADRAVFRPHRKFHQWRAVGKDHRCPVGDGVPNAFPPGVPRHPSQLYEAVWKACCCSCILRYLVVRVQIHRRPGLVVAWFLTLYGLFRFIGEFFRDSESKIYGWFSMGQALSLPMWIAAALLFWYALSQRLNKAST